MSLEVKKHRTIKMEDLGQADDLFRDVLERLKGIEFVVFSGTALGLFRDGELIPTDTDIDIIVPFKEGIEEKIGRAFHDYPLAVEARLNGKIQQFAFLPQDKLVDVHFYYPKDDEYVCRHMGGEFKVNKNQLDEPTIKDTKFGLIPFPKDVEKFLEQKYGNWQIPEYRKKGTY